ncbi:hypothetical protein [Metabacillus lacus]|nr:hypothetical protein [Metabacillus lacus]
MFKKKAVIGSISFMLLGFGTTAYAQPPGLTTFPEHADQKS